MVCVLVLFANVNLNRDKYCRSYVSVSVLCAKGSIMQVAIRKPTKGTLVPLWLHEYFAVHKSKVKVKGKREVDIYQAMEFSAGQDLPLQLRNGMSEKEQEEIWVKGVYFAPAATIRRAHPELRKDRFIFQKDNGSDWEPAVQYKAELGECPELVMVTNCTCWHPMSDVLHMLPRLVHPVDVQTHRVYVNGRDWHFVCGVMATERPHASLSKTKVSSCRSPTTGGFDLALMNRKQFSMYPEERLGGLISSPSSQWDNIDELFDCIRKVMSSGTGCVSGTFTLAWTNACQRFWEVKC